METRPNRIGPRSRIRNAPMTNCEVNHPRLAVPDRPEGSALPDQLPPGQYVPKRRPVLHYGRIPHFNPQKWTLRVCGATPGPVCWTWAEFGRLPRVDVIADFHCVTKFTLLGNRWTGVSTAQVLAAASPADGVSHVMVYGEYGYSANLRLADFAAADSLLATHRNGDLLTAEHGHPVRLVVPHLYAWKGPKWVRAIEYLTEDRRGAEQRARSQSVAAEPDAEHASEDRLHRHHDGGPGRGKVRLRPGLDQEGDRRRRDRGQGQRDPDPGVRWRS